MALPISLAIHLFFTIYPFWSPLSYFVFFSFVVLWTVQTSRDKEHMLDLLLQEVCMNDWLFTDESSLETLQTLNINLHPLSIGFLPSCPDINHK